MNVTNNLKLPQYTGEDIFDLQDVNKAYDSIDKAYGELDDTCRRLTNIKDEITTTNATAEVIDARGGKKTLGERFDEFGSQLDNNIHLGYEKTLFDNMKDRFESKYVNVKDFGVKGDGITDDTSGIKNAISYCEENKIDLFFPKGKYLV